MPPVSVVVAGDGTNSVTFTIPAAVEFTPESVVASIDASGAGDTIAELQIAERSGAVIAAKRQSEVVPAGDTGLATWALRLDTEAKAAAGGDYIFVAELAPLGFAGNMFFAVPSDARHLVIELLSGFASQVPGITLNGDTGAHYRTIAESVEDFNGTTSSTITSLDNLNGVPCVGMDGEFPSRAIITIPYCRQGSPINPHRSLQIESWTRTEDVPSGISLVRHVEQAAWWIPPAPNVNVRITSINIAIPGVPWARASFYKIV